MRFIPAVSLVQIQPPLPYFAINPGNVQGFVSFLLACSTENCPQVWYINHKISIQEMVGLKHLESSAHEYRVVPLEVRRTRTRIKPASLSLHIPVMTVLIGFFLARAVLLDELLPFGLAFLAAVCRSSRPRPGWALLGVLAGYASLVTSAAAAGTTESVPVI